MKGIALSTIALFLIAIVSITVLISFVGINVPNALKEGYCSMVQGLAGFLPLPEAFKPSLPSFCKPSIAQNLVYIESSEPERISFEIASYVMACWEMTGKINVGQNTNCYEIVIKRIEGKVDENSVRSQLPGNYKQLMEWRAGEIITSKSIGIFYNSTSKLVVVV
ncbi:MAG: hypothetical protein QXK48_03895 [Candidatus Aenigmatarchaeota archaeon]